MTTAADIARKAAEIMSERGHCKNTPQDTKGRVCFIGALNLAATGSAIPKSYNSDVFTILRKAWRARRGRCP